MAIGTFGPKTFTASSKKMNTIDDFTMGEGIQTEAIDVKGKKPSTYIKGIDLMTSGFTISLDARFCKVKAEIDSWLALKNKLTPQIFTLNKKVVSKNKFLIKSVSVADVVQGKDGLFLKAKLTIDLEEYVRAGVPKPEAKTTSGGGKPASGWGKGGGTGTKPDNKVVKKKDAPTSIVLSANKLKVGTGEAVTLKVKMNTAFLGFNVCIENGSKYYVGPADSCVANIEGKPGKGPTTVSFVQAFSQTGIQKIKIEILKKYSNTISIEVEKHHLLLEAEAAFLGMGRSGR